MYHKTWGSFSETLKTELFPWKSWFSQPKGTNMLLGNKPEIPERRILRQCTERIWLSLEGIKGPFEARNNGEHLNCYWLKGSICFWPSLDGPSTGGQSLMCSFSVQASSSDHTCVHTWSTLIYMMLLARLCLLPTISCGALLTCWGPHLLTNLVLSRKKRSDTSKKWQWILQQGEKSYAYFIISIFGILSFNYSVKSLK